MKKQKIFNFKKGFLNLKLNLMNKKAFTLVELIVVVTILSILSTIGFVSYSSYLTGVRDTSRVSQLKAIWDALHMYSTNKSLPIPDDKIDVTTDGSNLIAYQGFLGDNVIETISYTSEGKDPKDDTYFSYFLSEDRKFFQLLSYLEEENKDSMVLKNHYSLTKVNAIDYNSRYPYVDWDKLWILIWENNDPIQELETDVDLSNPPNWLVSYISNWETLTWTWNFLYINPKYNCKRLYQVQRKRRDGAYTIDPEGNWTWYKAYCDMENWGISKELVDWKEWSEIDELND